MSGGPWIQQLGITLLHFLWQGLLVACLLAWVMAAMQQRSAAARYRVRCLALLGMALCPVLTWCSLAPLVQPVHVHAAPGGTAGVTPLGWEAQVLAWFVGGWALGALWFLARLLVGLREVRGLSLSAGAPLPRDWQRGFQELCQRFQVQVQARLTRSASVAVPMVVGWLRPVVLLPARLVTGLTEEQVIALLAHELAHVRRHDALVNLCQTVLESLFFYHPAVWWVSRGIRVEREFCCDDMAVAAVGRALPYARALATLETIRGTELRLAPSSRGGPLMLRVQRLVGDRRATDRGFLLRSLPGATGLLLMGALGASAWAGGASPTDDGAGQETWRRVILTWQADGPGAPTSRRARIVVDPAQDVCPECGHRREQTSSSPVLRGRVLDATGAPVQDARVILREGKAASKVQADVLLRTVAEGTGDGPDVWVTRWENPGTVARDADGDDDLDLWVTNIGEDGGSRWEVGGARPQIRTDAQGRWEVQAVPVEVHENRTMRWVPRGGSGAQVDVVVDRLDPGTYDVLLQNPLGAKGVIDFTQPKNADPLDLLLQETAEGEAVYEYRVRRPAPAGGQAGIAQGRWVTSDGDEFTVRGRVVEQAEAKPALSAPPRARTYQIELRGEVVVTPTEVQANEISVREISTTLEPPVRVQEERTTPVEHRSLGLHLELKAKPGVGPNGEILLEVVPVLDPALPEAKDQPKQGKQEVRIDPRRISM